MKKLTLAVASLAFSAATLADSHYNPALTLGIGAGQTFFASDRIVGDLVRGVEDHEHGVVNLGYQFANPFAIEATYLFNDTQVEGASQTDVDLQQYRLDLLYSLSNKKRLQPYLAIGGGYNEFSVDGAGAHAKESIVDYGMGAKYYLNNVLALRGDVRGITSLDEEETDVAATVGLHIFLGYGGGPISGDKQASAAPAPVAEAPKVADSDGDGVADNIDVCANTPAGTVVNDRGCPLDSDGDGVADASDQCPDSEAGAKVDEKGCYIILTESREIELEVKFATNSDVVPEAYMSEIEEVANFMRQYPTTNVQVEGHTDSQGSAAYNQQLSERRSSSVAAVLVNRYGVSGSRVSSVGYGEDKPIADNATAAGRAENRRVVAVISASVEKRAQ